MAHVLVIDDDSLLIPEQARHAFPAPEYRLTFATDGAAGLACVRDDPPDVVLLDLRLPDRSGLDVFEDIRAIDARLPVIFATVAKSADTAIEAMKHGAFNYLSKPLDVAKLRATVLDALDVVHRMRAPVTLGEPLSDDDDGGIFGACPSMLEIYKAIGRVAGQDVTVLVTGESGTGKELVARAIYQHSTRANAAFHAMNCAAIPDALLESELFGHERAAFTGADRRRVGKFEQCNGGTLLLDEIGDMPLALQAKVLRLIQEQTFERVGGNETVRTNVRLIASTHRDLRARATNDLFRTDLYYRLSVFTIHLPPLRERGEDLPMLAAHFVRRYGKELGRSVTEIAPDAMNRLRAYSWPGNVRELQSVIKQALLQARGTVLLASFLPELCESSAPAASTRPGRLDLESFIRDRLDPNANDLHAQTHREVDRLLLTMVLDYTGGNQRNAARMLGISRQTMRGRMLALGLSVASSVKPDVVEP